MHGSPGAGGSVRKLASPAAVVLVVRLAVLGTVVALFMRDFDNNVYIQIGIVLLIFTPIIYVVMQRGPTPDPTG